MKILSLVKYLSFALVTIFTLNAQAVDYSAVPSQNLNYRNLGKWITPDDVSNKEGVFLFRKTFKLSEKPEKFVINVSADNRYRLYVNGTPVCFGPARGDFKNWYFETLDIAPLLKKGKNVLAAEVWNFAKASPDAQLSHHTAFVIFPNSKAEEIVATNKSWKFAKEEGRKWGGYTITVLAGRAEVIDGSKLQWGWEQVDFDDSKWESAKFFSAAVGYCASFYGEIRWGLTPRDIPLMELTSTSFKEVRRTSGIDSAQNIIEKKPLKIPANTKCSILLDQSFLTTAYLEMLLSGGKGAVVKVAYAENLYDAKREKGNRNDIEGKNIERYSPTDTFIVKGGEKQLYRPLWMRAYRYVQLDIATADEELVIEKYDAQYTGYPFKELGSFESDDKSLAKIWEAGWRTARLCAHETYFDCPFYEQLQYVGDTRIQALISLYVAGDARLMKKALLLFDNSRSSDGITRSRYPSYRPQFIPPFSLIWINMLGDYQRHVDDPEFVKARLDSVRTIIAWYEKQIDSNTGFLKANLPYWNFVDWVSSWPRGIPPDSDKSGSALHSMHLAYALDDAVKLMQKYGFNDEAKKYLAMSASIKKNVYEKCWDSQKGILRDCIGEDFYSQHTNSLAILTDTIPQDKQLSVFEKITENPLPNGKKFHGTAVKAIKNRRVCEATFYYKFYVMRAMKKIGLGDKYVEMLSPWHGMIEKGLTTFSENPDPCRSECHAWSSSPNYDFLATVCGIEPDSDAFKSVKVEPHMGILKHVKGKVPHKLGFIEVEFKKDNKGAISGFVKLPKGLEGRFVYRGLERKLSSGFNKIGE